MVLGRGGRPDSRSAQESASSPPPRSRRRRNRLMPSTLTFKALTNVSVTLAAAVATNTSHMTCSALTSCVTLAPNPRARLNSDLPAQIVAPPIHLAVRATPGQSRGAKPRWVSSITESNKIALSRSRSDGMRRLARRSGERGRRSRRGAARGGTRWVIRFERSERNIKERKIDLS